MSQPTLHESPIYVSQKDDYLRSQLLSKIADEFTKVLRHTWYTFLAPAGDVVYLFTCSPVIVKAAPTDRCYDQLRVEIVIYANARADQGDDEWLSKDTLLYLKP